MAALPQHLEHALRSQFLHEMIEHHPARLRAVDGIQALPNLFLRGRDEKSGHVVARGWPQACPGRREASLKVNSLILKNGTLILWVMIFSMASEGRTTGSWGENLQDIPGKEKNPRYFSAVARSVWKCGASDSRETMEDWIFENPAFLSIWWRSISAKPSQTWA